MRGGLSCCLAACLLAPPPSGRPPSGALQRVNPQLWSVTVSVHLPVGLTWDEPPPLRWPLISETTFSTVDADTFEASVSSPGRPRQAYDARVVESGAPFGQHEVRLPLPPRMPPPFSWQIAFRATAWSSRLDDEVAATIPWPQIWPNEVVEAMQPQFMIESDEAIFTNAVQEITGGRLNLVPPFLAAKELIRATLAGIRCNGQTTANDRRGGMRGLSVQGALHAASSGRGSTVDLACACVAMLRAAGIPARLVVGLRSDRNLAELELLPGAMQIAALAEFWLPQAGWIPFDPYALQLQGASRRDVTRPWFGLGTMLELNRFVPLAYTLAPDNGAMAYDCVALWGWQPIFPDRPLPVPERITTVPLGDEQVLVEYRPTTIRFEFVSLGAVPATRP